MPADPPATEVRSDLVDVSLINFREVAEMSGSAITRSLLRIKAELDRPQDAVAGFQSAAPANNPTESQETDHA